MFSMCRISNPYPQPKNRFGFFVCFGFFVLFCFFEKSSLQAMVSLIPALWKQKLDGPLSSRQPDLQTEFQNSQSYTKQSCLRETERQRKRESLYFLELTLQTKLTQNSYLPASVRVLRLKVCAIMPCLHTIFDYEGVRRQATSRFGQHVKTKTEVQHACEHVLS